MRDWRNRQTRAFKGRVGDRVGSSPTSRTKKNGNTTSASVFYCLCVFCLSANLANKVGRNTPLRSVAFALLRSARLRGRRAFLGIPSLCLQAWEKEKCTIKSNLLETPTVAKTKCASTRARGRPCGFKSHISHQKKRKHD